MEKHREEFSAEKMAKVLGVSRSGFYHYLVSGPSSREQENEKLLENIRSIHAFSRGTYGSPRIHAELRVQGKFCNHKRVARLMRVNGIHAKMVKKYKTTTKSDAKMPAKDNLIQQNFTAEKANQKWVSDISYVWTLEGWLYLAVILDLFSRKVVGIGMSNRITREIVINALNQACLRRSVPKGLVYHSDRGKQYASFDFQNLVQSYGMLASMSGKGNCYDNAVAESFFHTLKTECIYFENYKTREEAEKNIFEYIEVFYNNYRRHSYLGYLSPNEFERQAFGSEESVH